MATFPLLATGAVTQYPAFAGSSQAVSIVRYLDGSDQRWLSQGRAFRRWRIDLRLLNDSEVNALETFFETQQGEYSSFVFTDPFTGQLVPHCRFSDGALTTEYDAPGSAATSLWIVETNG